MISTRQHGEDALHEMVESQHATTRTQVLEFVASQRGMDASELDDETDLFLDTGLYGDDVDEFFLEFCQRFGLPSDGNYLEGVFPGERAIPHLPFLERLFPMFAFKPTKQVRVRHLVQAAREGAWPV